MSTPTIDVTANPKQAEYFRTVLSAADGLNPFRYFGYGGAIRGGKTYITLAILAVLCRKFPGSKWHICRQDFPVLEKTTIPSMQKLLRGSRSWTWKRDRSNYRIEHENGSTIFFMPENITRDPELMDFLGLETNGFFLEQTEELSLRLWERALERAGSWYIDPMPPAFIFLTFNPTQLWVKDLLYDPWVKGELEEPFYFMPALPQDNPYVTSEQWSAWDRMAERYRRQMIGGDWTDFDDQAAKRWAFSYDPKKHSKPVQVDKSRVLWLSFDFNKDPITCVIGQHYGGRLRIPRTIKLPSSDIYALCDAIKLLYPGYLYMVTGDATGARTSALVKDNLNFYRVIREKLNLADGQFKVPTVNPGLVENRVLVNSVLSNYPVDIDPDDAKDLHFDLRYVKVTDDKKIDKSSRSDPTKQADTLDGFRYLVNAEFGGWYLT